MSTTPAPTTTPPKNYHWGPGRRKTAVARVRIREGTGQLLVNDREMNNYFPDVLWQLRVHAPLQASDLLGKIDCFVNVKGGGVSSQAGAVQLGLARALVKYRADLETTLRDHGYLTRDSRMVERKKYGHKKARKSFQFSKR
ncbi:MAG: 30S ribosomal protein S9 [Planctomycetes bacterium]|nr:30S ribosomal protein S9 [Planctomycetota bacterium]